MGKDQNIDISISLDPPYYSKAYLSLQNIYREDDIMYFMHDLSPSMELSKYEALGDKNLPSQSTKQDMNYDRKENPPLQDIPYSCTCPFVPSKQTYTTNLKEIHYNVPPPFQLKDSYRSYFNIISKQSYRG